MGSTKLKQSKIYGHVATSRPRSECVMGEPLDQLMVSFNDCYSILCKVYKI